MARNIPQTVEDRIRRRERRGRNIKIDQAKAISYPQSSRNDDYRAPNSLVWNLRYMLAELYGQVGTAVGDISFAVTANALTVTFGNNTGNGVFDADDLTWTDGAKSWTVNQWVGYYLKVGTVYYKVLSNTTTALTLDLSKGELIVAGAYTLVPFIPNMHKDGFLNPDTGADRRYKITGNTETVISVNSKNVAAGTVTTGDAGAPYKTFRDSAFTGYEDDALNGFSIHWPTGDNNGESDTIFDFTGATGEIVVATGFTNTIDVSDTFLIVDDMLYAGSSSEWRTEKYYPLSSSDFTDANPEEIHIVQLPTSNGAIVDSRMQAGYAAMYSVEVLSKTQRNISVPIEIFEESLRIELTDLGTGTTQVLYDSGFRPAIAPSVEFMLRSNTWHRMDVYLYVADGQIDTPSGEVIDFRFDPLSAFITTWRDVTSTIPTGIVITGADTSNAADVGTMRSNSIEISWVNSILLGQGGVTEIWHDDAESFLPPVILTKVPTAVTQITSTFDPDTDEWFKLRHVSASGTPGPYSSARRGIVASGAFGNTEVDLIWVDNGGSTVYPNENGWLTESTLKAKITVTSDLTIDQIFFKQPGAAWAGLGSSSPATSAAIISETAGAYVLVSVAFTNGLHMPAVSFAFKYDKTAPGNPTIDSFDHQNMALHLVLNSGYSYPSDFLHFQIHYDTDNSAPSNDRDTNDIQTTTSDLIITLPLSSFLFGDTVYLWVRSRDKAGNVGGWISTNTPVNNMSANGSMEIVDLLEMSWNDGN